MAPEAVEIQQGEQAGNDIRHILGLEPDIDDRRRWSSALPKDQLPEISVARNENSFGSDRVGQDVRIAAVRHDSRRTHHVMPFGRERKRYAATDICVAKQLQAARARPAAM